MINRLTTLYQLQIIDDQLDELEELRGDLPLTVNELTFKIRDIQSQVNSKLAKKEASLEKRKSNDTEIELLQTNLKKFKAQLYQVRNNKEYDALTKEIDHSEEAVDKLENESLALEDLVEKLKMEIEESEPLMDQLKEELKVKEEELKKIIKSNEREEAKFRDKREKVVTKVKKNDYNTYMRIRKALSGKAVVTVTRSACSGCHNIVPSQRQIEIRQNKRLFTCESCGRLLVSNDIAEEAEKTTF
ncbi:MAG: hypothetical protein KJ799_06210 [Bacteroidetes bacterium]|nr:hypothetical protein [Bacteroidota bacterium]MBU1677315.1 hypothetical protein [Bacteroidota bacterium]MBU2506302.1 hypothetical protein [Bacteroidota bacterium]